MCQRVSQSASFSMAASFSYSTGNTAPGAGAAAFAGIGPNGQPVALAAAGTGAPGQGAFAGAGVGQNGQVHGPRNNQQQGPGGKLGQLVNFLKGFMMGKMLSQILNGGQGQGQQGSLCGCNSNPAFGGAQRGNAFAAAGAFPGGGAPFFGSTLGSFLG